MRYLSVCSGIEAASVAWHPLGWEAVAFAEIDAFPRAVLAHHYPTVPNWGDLTKFKDWPDATFDVLVGGTPCQSFSVAGLRKGLDDPRGNLTLTYLAVLDRYRPGWCVWENVPGVLSSDEGRAFGSFLGGLGQLGYGFAYRVLDAQFFGVAQRRRRVFVVGCLGGWQRAAAVLFDGASLCGHPPPRREAGKGAPTIPSRRTAGGGLGTDCDGGLIPFRPGSHGHFVEGVGTLSAQGGGSVGQGGDETLLVAHSLRADGFDASEDGTGRGTPIVSVFDERQVTSPDNRSRCEGDISPTMHEKPFTLAIRGCGDSHDLEYRQDGTANAILTPNGGRAGIGVGAIAFQPGNLSRGAGAEPNDEVFPSLTVSKGSGTSDQQPHVMSQMAVRRLTPMECERLQGFPDGYTLVPYRNKPAADGNRYKALGNSMAVPVMAWIGKRMQFVHALIKESTV